MYTQNTKTKRPITYRQMRAVECWIKGGRKSKAQALREAGYSKAVIRQPHKVFDSHAVQEELDKRGFGRKGLHNNLKPTAVILDSFDATKLTPEHITRLREQLGYEVCSSQ